jgi:hypothetical protein
VFHLLSLTTAAAIGLAVITNYPQVAVAISVMLVATTAVYYSDKLLRFANTSYWAVLTEAILAIVGTLFIATGILCLLAYHGHVSTGGVQVWLFSALLIVAGLLCILRAWVLTMRRGG